MVPFPTLGGNARDAARSARTSHWGALWQVGLGRNERDLDRYYVARRLDETDLYIITRTELEPLAHLHYQSDAAFQWGWGCLTAGSREFAFSMLAHTTESRPTDLVCDLFSAEVMACLDPAGFVVSSEDIAVWLTTVFSDGESSPHQQDRDDHVGLGPRAVGWVRARLGRT